MADDKLKIATAIICNNGRNIPNNKSRSELLKRIIEKSKDVDIILLPAGYYYIKEKLNEDKGAIEKNHIISQIQEMKSNATICVGIDFNRNSEEIPFNQLAYAVSSQDGIIAQGQKFFPAPQEIGKIAIHKYEDGLKDRIFKMRNKSFLLAVCYDSYGIRKQDSCANPAADTILNLVHCYYNYKKNKEGEKKPSGDSYFAKWGFAGASGKWQCPLFASAVYFDDRKPNNCPYGVFYNREMDSESLRKLKYTDFKIEIGNKTDRTEFINDEYAVIYTYDYPHL